MKRIIVICEGQTEEEFVRTTLQNYLGSSKNIYFSPVLIKKSNGGIVPWKYIKKQIEIHLKEDKEVFVTTLLDYYGIYGHHSFPAWEEAHKIVNKNERLNTLEKAMKDDIDSELKNRFIPFLLLHEFEAFIFSDKDELLKQIDSADIKNIKELDNIFSQFPNPENINDGVETSPSKRLLKIINGYDKIVYGNIIIEAIGIHKIRSKAARFDKWLNSL